jgi:glutathione S-transferase
VKLFHSPSSPFVRKVMVCAIELGLRDRIECVASAAHPVDRNPRIVDHNPLGQVPTLVTDDGLVLYDSRVICEYLDHLAGRRSLFPQQPPARWTALRDQALADGLLDAALLIRYERLVRDEAFRSEAWTRGQFDKVDKALAAIERQAGDYPARVDIGTIAVACALGYLDFRFAELPWRARCTDAARWFAAFSRRESMRATLPAIAGS